MELYYNRDFKGAVERFQQVQRILPQDFAAELMENRCLDYIQNPPPANWDGVEVMDHK